MQVRRVVTGHDSDGNPRVIIDETNDVAIRETGFGGHLFWTTEGFPVDNSGDEDASQRQVRTSMEDGTIFRVVEFAPGNSARRHRTDSIDYAVVMTGEIDMELDGDQVVHLKAGDVLVQRGTVHNWVNRGTQNCAIAFILIDARPVEVAGNTLHAEG